MLRKDRKKLEELKKLETISLEELIEKERTALNAIACTKVTLETFIAWKKKKILEKKKKIMQAEKEKKANIKIGKQVWIIFGYCNLKSDTCRVVSLAGICSPTIRIWLEMTMKKLVAILNVKLMNRRWLIICVAFFLIKTYF